MPCAVRRRGGAVARLAAAAALSAAVAVPLHAQAGGAVVGRVTAADSQPVVGAVVELGRGVYGAVTDQDGTFRIAEVRPGTYRVVVRAVGYRPAQRDSVAVTGGQTLRLNVSLVREAVEIEGVVVEAEPDRFLDPEITETVQRIDGEELRALPFTTVEEAVAARAGVVDGSFRGGRLGQEVFVVDGLAIKNHLDASSSTLGIRIPAVALEEATLVTNGFSARYGQALSGVISTVTRDGGDRLEGRLAYESDRPLPDGGDVGLDRVVLSGGGPLMGPLRFFAAADAQARIDDDPVNAPRPVDPRDPRSERPWLLPHNAGERYDLLGKLTVPIGARQTVRLLGVLSEQQRLLFEPALKYTEGAGPAERVSGRLAMAHLQRVSGPDERNTTILELRAGYFESEGVRAPLVEQPDRRFGAFTFERFRFAGAAIAEARDSVAALDAVPGFAVPAFEDDTPWGVPAFFATASPRGELRRNRFREARIRADAFLGRGRATDLRAGGEYASQRVETFTRLEAYRAVADTAPAPRRSTFSPFQASGYVELQQRASDLTFTLGVRGDVFDARVPGDTATGGTKVAVSPRIAVSTALAGATVIASVGRFAQPPDFQYLVDAAFDDSLRTGRFRQGNPNLGFETSIQYELQVRVRAGAHVGIRGGAFVKRLDGLVASIPLGFDPDSAIFGNGDFGNVRGVELEVEREYADHWGVRVTYALQHAEATASNARDLFRRLQISPDETDTIIPATVAFPLDFDRRHALIIVGRGQVPRSAGAVFGGFQGGVVARWSSGLPYSRTTADGDSLVGLPNSHRLPFQFGIDLLLRREFPLGGRRLAVYADLRNLTNHRNVIAVRRDTGEPGAGGPQIAEAAQDAFSANPTPIPYESPRYRAWADLDGNGLIEGPGELLPLYERAARDFLQPLFSYGPPRLVRLGIEVAF